MFSEAIRRVRVGIDQAVLRRQNASGDTKTGGMIVMVTSASPNEGKTTLSLSLTRAYALAGRSTLLIDCDLRKPSVHKQLGIEPSIGLLEFLANPAAAPQLAEILTLDAPSGAQIAIGARRSDIATDQLISGKTFETLIEAARKRFEVIILDTPPIGPVVDGLYLAKYADVIAFVVRWAATSQQDVKAAVTALRASKTPDVEILAVLNQQDRARAAYYNKYAAYYSEA